MHRRPDRHKVEGTRKVGEHRRVDGRVRRTKVKRPIVYKRVGGPKGIGTQVTMELKAFTIGVTSDVVSTTTGCTILGTNRP